MLVYIRDADKDKVVCNVDEKDIAEHLQVRCITDIIEHIFLLQEQTELSASYGFIDSMWGDMIRLENFSIYESFVYRKYPAQEQCEVDITCSSIPWVQIRLKKEQEEKVRKRKDKAEAHLYTIIKVITTCFSMFRFHCSSFVW